MWASTREILSLGFANSKGADQPAHTRRLISAFVISFLERIKSELKTGFVTSRPMLCCIGGQEETGSIRIVGSSLNRRSYFKEKYKQLPIKFSRLIIQHRILMKIDYLTLKAPRKKHLKSCLLKSSAANNCLTLLTY